MSRFDDGRASGGPRSSDRDEPARGDQDKSWRGGGGGGGFRDSRGSGGSGDRAGGSSWRGGGGGGGLGGSGGGSSRFGSAGSAAPPGERPRLNLKPRSSDGSAPSSGGGVAAAGSGISKMRVDDKEPRREAPSTNSRAAALGSAPEYRHSQLRQEGRPDRGAPRASGPPLVANKRIASLAEEEREKKREQSRSERSEGPPEPIGSSRFAAPLRDESRGPPRESGPPPMANSRFAAAAAMAKQEDATRESRGPPRFSEGGGGGGFSRNSGPPPAQNSRFAAAAAADSDHGDRGDRDNRGPRMSDDRGSGGGGFNRGGPPPAQNSRFAAAAAADSDYGDRGDRGGPRGPRDRDGGGRGFGRDDRDGGGRGFGRDDRGGGGHGRDRDDRGGGGYGRDRDDRGGGGGGYGRDRDDRGGGGYGRDRDDRGGGGYGRDRDDRGGGGYGRDRDDRGGGGYGRDRDDRGGYGDRRQGGGYGGDRGAGGGFGGSGDLSSLPRGPRSSQMDELPTGPRSSAFDNSSTSRVDELLKTKIASLAEANTLKLPDATAAPEHAENILKVAVPLTKKDDDVLFMAPAKKKVEGKSKETKAAAPAVSAEKYKELLAEFASGNRKGGELKVWVQENRSSLPTIDQLVFAMLVEQEKNYPDPECKWAEPEKFGSALLSLVEHDIVGQMQVLWGIQFYCEKLGFPKLNNEYIVQAMFRAMYKYDLAEHDAFTEWKEDETEACEKGKLKAIIQTVDWFAWLDEADDDEEEEEEEEEEVAEEEG